MNVKKIKLIKLENLRQVNIYREYLARLEQARQEGRQTALPDAELNKQRTGSCLS